MKTYTIKTPTAELETLKNNYAQEQGYENWADLYRRAGYYDEMEFFKHEDAVFILAQKAALEKAAENGVAYKLNYPNNTSKAVVEKDSITNPENLIR